VPGALALAFGFGLAATPVDIEILDGASTLTIHRAFASGKGSGRDDGASHSGRRGGRDRTDDNPTPGDDDGTPDQGTGDR
jgi:hypothetical protein